MVTTPTTLRRAALAAVILLTAGQLGAASPQAKRAEDELEFGYKAARRGYWQEALARFELAAELTPNQPRILNNIAVALEANGRFDEARTTYRAALALDPGNSRLRTNFERFEEFYANHVAAPEPPGDEPEAAPAAADDTPAGEGEE